MPVEPAIERYKAVRGQIEHESTLVGIRLGWLIAAESFLFAGYATVLTVTKGVPDKFGSGADTLFRFCRLPGWCWPLVWLAQSSLPSWRWAACESSTRPSVVRAAFRRSPETPDLSTTRGQPPPSWSLP